MHEFHPVQLRNSANKIYTILSTIQQLEIVDRMMISWPHSSWVRQKQASLFYRSVIIMIIVPEKTYGHDLFFLFHQEEEAIECHCLLVEKYGVYALSQNIEHIFSTNKKLNMK